MEQWGTPEEIYYQPKSRFVAEFVTQANFFKGDRQGDKWSTEIGDFYLPDQDSQVTQGEIAISPENVVLTPTEEGLLLIRNRRFIGREYQYLLVTPKGLEFPVRVINDRPLTVGTKVNLTIDSSKVHFFPKSV